MEKLGTNYGGWYVPKELKLNSDSVILDIGIGEDVSFPLNLSHKYDPKIILLDPTKKSIKHWDEIKNYFKDKNYKFKGNIQKDYYTNIKNLKPHLDNFKYIPVGLWNKKTILKFYKQTNKNHVSQSLIKNMFSSEYDLVQVDTLKNIMKSLNITKIDVFKMDIEGAEIQVLNQMIIDNIQNIYWLNLIYF